MAFDIVDGILHRGDLFGVFVRNFHSETLFERHNQFDRIQRIRAEIVDKGSCRRYFGLVDA